MRRLLGVLLLSSALVLTACGDGGNDINSKEDLLEHVRKELERRGAPTAMADCVVDELDRRLDLSKVKAAYDKLPDDASDAQVEQVLGNSSINEDTTASVLACARKLGLPLPRQ
jgi:galactitol-specific phosphotransferase system IIB component